MYLKYAFKEKRERMCERKRRERERRYERKTREIGRKRERERKNALQKFTIKAAFTLALNNLLGYRKIDT